MLVLNGISFSNIIFSVALIVGIVGFCVYHWQAYRLHIVREHSVDAMVLSSLRGSTFIAILLSGGATLQSLQILCVYLLSEGYVVDSEFGKRLGAVVALIILTGVFCVIFWLLRGVHFLAQRLKKDAQFEIRRYAEAVASLLGPELEQLGIDVDDLR